MFKKSVTFLGKHYFVFVLLVLYFLFSFFTYRTYGITYDESFVYNRANALYTHLLTDNVDPNISYTLLFQSSPLDVNIYYNNTYGMILRIFNPTNNYAIYHLLNLLFASFIIVASYALLYAVFKKQKYAILGPLFICLSPVFFGHIPVNPKDMPFAVFYFSSLCFIYFFGKKRSLFSIIIIGLFFGLAQSGRIVGFVLYPTFLLYRLYLFFAEKNKKISKNFYCRKCLIFFLFSSLPLL